jgi:hypothetical protein
MFGPDITAFASLLEQHTPQTVAHEKPKTKVSVKTREEIEAEKRAKTENIFSDVDVIVPKQPTSNSKKQPKHEILFQQKVKAEDVFFNLGDMDNSSDHCENITVKIHMTGAQLSDITLDVFTDRLLVQSGDYYLSLALPVPVKKDDGNAKWDKNTQVLSVTLPISRLVKYVADPADAFA